MGYNEYADVVVSKMRKESRGFVRDRYVANLRRRVADWGSNAAAVVNCDDASSGSCASSGCVVLASNAASFRSLLLR